MASVVGVRSGIGAMRQTPLFSGIIRDCLQKGTFYRLHIQHTGNRRSNFVNFEEDGINNISQDGDSRKDEGQRAKQCTSIKIDGKRNVLVFW